MAFFNLTSSTITTTSPGPPSRTNVQCTNGEVFDMSSFIAEVYLYFFEIFYLFNLIHNFIKAEQFLKTYPELGAYVVDPLFTFECK